MANLCDLWLANAAEAKSADYEKTTSSLIDLHIRPLIGDVIITQLAPLRVSAWLRTLRNTPARNRGGKLLSDRTVRHIYMTLNSVCRWAVQYDILPTSPLEKLDPPKARKHRPAFLDDDQAVDLLRNLQHEENMSFRAAVMLALMAGLRLGEVDAITWSDVDWKNCCIDVSKAVKQTPRTGRYTGNPKTDDGVRLLAVPAALMALLDETRKAQQEARDILGDRYRDHDLIVCNFDGTPQNKDTPSKQWRKFADAHGYPGVTFHNLRTTHATLLLANNIDAVAVAGRLGHSDATTTLRYYAGLVARRGRDGANVLDQLAARAIPPQPSQLPTVPISITTTPDYTIATYSLHPQLHPQPDDEA